MVIYRHDDSGAPTLTAANGSLIALLDACLVNGYGSQSAAGWTKAFSDTNKAAYRQGTGSNAFYLRVDNSWSATYASMRGFVSMSDIDTGSGPFPTTTQLANGAWCVTSASSDSTARPWMIAADAKRFWLYIGYDNTTAESIAGSTTYKPWHFFGDILSRKPGDAYHTLLIATNTTAASANYAATWIGSGAGVYGHYLARANDQTTESVYAGKITSPMGNHSTTSRVSFSDNGPAYPDPVTDGLLVAPVWIMESTGAGKLTRGRLPGLWATLHSPLAGSPGDTVAGSTTGGLSGRSFMLMDAASATTRQRVALETSQTWES